MAKPVAVFFADSHLQRRAWANRPSLSHDSTYGFRQIVDYAVKHNLDVVGGGDLLDEARPNAWVVNAMRRCLASLRKANLRLYVIQGQHDRDDPPWVTAVGGVTASYVHEKTFRPKDSDVVWYGLDNLPPGELRIALETMPTCDVLVTHQSWHGLGNIPMQADAELKDVRHASLLLSGDVHVNQSVSTFNNEGRRLLAVSPGSTCMQSIDEQPDKYFAVVYDDLTVKFEPLKVRPVIVSPMITNEEQLEAFLASAKLGIDKAKSDLSMPTEICRPIVWARYVAEIPKAYHRLTRELIDAHVFLKPIKTVSETVRAAEQAATEELLQRGVQGCIETDLKDQPVVMELAKRLWRSTNLNEDLMAMRTEILG